LWLSRLWRLLLASCSSKKETPGSEAECRDKKNGSENSPGQAGSTFAFGFRRRLENRNFIQGRGGWLIGAGRGEVIGYGLLFIETNAPRIGPDESFIEDAAGKTLKLVFF